MKKYKKKYIGYYKNWQFHGKGCEYDYDESMSFEISLDSIRNLRYLLERKNTLCYDEHKVFFAKKRRL